MQKKFHTIKEIQIERNQSGKPYVVDSKLKISLAHSKNWAACSVGEVKNGIDVEEDFAAAIAIAQKFFHSAGISATLQP